MKPIRLCKEDKEKIIEEVRQKLDKDPLAGGKFEYSTSFYYEKGKDFKKPTIKFTSTAWNKMRKLVEMFNKEIGWQGLIKRISDKEWLIYDILVYKQKVSGVTVDTDDDDFNKFIVEAWGLVDIEAGESPNFQGHSHVEMSVSPSTVDLNDQATRMKGMTEGYYVFTIQNKKGDSSWWIYDFDNNVMYDTKEIEIEVEGDEYTKFAEAAKQLVSDTYKYIPTYGGYGKTANTISKDNYSKGYYTADDFMNGKDYDGYYD